MSGCASSHVRQVSDWFPPRFFSVKASAGRRGPTQRIVPLTRAKWSTNSRSSSYTVLASVHRLSRLPARVHFQKPCLPVAGVASGNSGSIWRRVRRISLGSPGTSHRPDSDRSRFLGSRSHSTCCIDSAYIPQVSRHIRGMFHWFAASDAQPSKKSAIRHAGAGLSSRNSARKRRKGASSRLLAAKSSGSWCWATVLLLIDPDAGTGASSGRSLSSSA
eukprot:TRINITY_DN14990_c0_g1_i1.p2 TRINITY_DN14990_c0_g1~~TRINITY_DN14990_c0_g1_i1.p2  ORF type:complete len:218 (+),score=-32.06 TRINITY_DN14990_c0_g1_i1:893-1546(+)